MIYDKRLSPEMNRKIDEIKDEFGTEEHLKLVLEKYDGFKNGTLADWSITEEDKKYFIRLLEIETRLVHAEKEKIAWANREIDARVDDFVTRRENNDFDDGIERIKKEKKKGFFDKLFGK